MHLRAGYKPAGRNAHAPLELTTSHTEKYLQKNGPIEHKFYVEL